MNVLIADALPPETRAGLAGLGLSVTEDATLGAHNLPGAVKDIDILVVGGTRVTRRTIEAGERLRLILHAGSGGEGIDLAAASARGIFVSHCAGADASARAEHVFALLLALDRPVGRPFGTADASPPLGLRGRSLGLYGFDATARRVREIAHAFGMRVHVYDESLTTARASEAEVHRCDSPEELFRRAELISLHPEARDATPIVTADRLDAMVAGATLINIAGRGLIDLQAARARLEAGTLRLGLDVYDADDYGDDVPFAADAYPGLVATDRLAAKTAQSADAIAHVIVDHVEKYLMTDQVPECLNTGGHIAPRATLLVRFQHAEGVLAALLDSLREGDVHVLSIETAIFDDCAAAWARIAIDKAPEPSVLAALRREPRLIQLDVK